MEPHRVQCLCIDFGAEKGDLHLTFSTCLFVRVGAALGGNSHALTRRLADLLPREAAALSPHGDAGEGRHGALFGKFLCPTLHRIFPSRRILFP